MLPRHTNWRGAPILLRLRDWPSGIRSADVPMALAANFNALSVGFREVLIGPSPEPGSTVSVKLSLLLHGVEVEELGDGPAVRLLPRTNTPKLTQPVQLFPSLGFAHDPPTISKTFMLLLPLSFFSSTPLFLGQALLARRRRRGGGSQEKRAAQALDAGPTHKWVWTEPGI